MDSTAFDSIKLDLPQQADGVSSLMRSRAECALAHWYSDLRGIRHTYVCRIPTYPVSVILSLQTLAACPQHSHKT